MDNPLFSRRLFLSRGVGLLSVAGTLPLFLDRSARALAADFAANPQGAGRPDRVLVVIQLAGGNDGLNMVIPYTNDHYYKARPRIGIPRKSVLRADHEFGFHPNAAGLKELFDDGHLAVLHAVGYPNPNRSHFRSTDIWATGEPQKTAHSGWLGRYFDACCSGSDPGHATQVPASSAIALTSDPPTALQGEKFLPIAFRDPDALTFREAGRNAHLRSAFDKLNDVDHQGEMSEPGMTSHKEATEDFLQRTALDARVYAEQIKKSAAGVRNKAAYPQSRFASDLKLVAQMIASGLSTRVYYVSLGGFDTHSNQTARHERLMTELGGGLAAFVKDLKELGHLDRTAVMTFSEFGRRVGENGSGGTDHGEAAPLLVAGSAVHAGFHGTFPDLTPARLHRGDVPFTLDFRRLYATMLHDWLRADPARVLGGRFEPLRLLKTA